MQNALVTTLLLGSLCAPASLAYYRLHPLSHIQFPTSIVRGVEKYDGLDRHAVTNAAYDFVNNIVYVIGKANHLMHLVDIADPSNPKVLFTHQFTTSDGVPNSISICGNEVAIGLDAYTDVNEGHVRYYHTFVKGSGATDLSYDGYVTVGAHPDHIQYTRDCGSILVPNEGEPGKDETGHYQDPEATITIIHSEKTGNPSVKPVDFQDFNIGQPNYRSNIRVPSMFIPTSIVATTTTLSQSVEPEYAAISDNMKTAWITLPATNAIAEMDFSAGLITNIYNLPLKDWSTIAIDASDRDGGVHRRVYPGLKSLRQPTVIKPLTIGKKTFLFTADKGEIRSFNNAEHGFTWSDAVTAKTLVDKINNPDLKAAAGNDEFLGRLQVSQIDGKNALLKYDNLTAFGGRGFSIWDSTDFSRPVFDSDGSLEEYMEAYKKNVFNTDYTATNAFRSPEGTRDEASDNQGSVVSALDVKDDNGTTFLVVGTSSTGTLFLYDIGTSSGQPNPSFQSIYRAGITDLPWTDLYANKTAGDLFISDIGIITSDHSPVDRPLVYVISKGAGTMSLYEIIDDSSPIGR